MQVIVVIRGEDGSQRTETLEATTPITIGRSTKCTVRLDSDRLSRQHAVVTVSASGLRVEDTSTNGTIAGDTLLKHQALDVPYGTRIVVGDYTLSVLASGAALQQFPASSGNPSMRPQGASIDPNVRTAAIPLASLNIPGRVANASPGGMQNPSIGVGRGATPSLAATPAAARQHAPAAQGATPKAATSTASLEARKRDVDLRRDIHRMLLEHLDLATIDAKKLDDPSMRPKVLGALRRIFAQIEARIPATIDKDSLVGELADEALGLGPLERFLADPSVSEIMVIDPDTIYVEQNGKLILSDARFTDDERCRAVIERIVTPLGRRIDESSPLVDARLKDGSRVNAIIKPLALRGSCITIRKFSRNPLTMDKLVGFGALNEQMARFLTRSVIAKRNIVISGGTGSGKTTLLNVLSAAIPEHERVVTIEDAAELQLRQPPVVSLETQIGRAHV